MRKLTLMTLCVALIFSLFNASSAQAAFRKGPYLQNVTQNSITVVWQTDTDTGGGTVHYGVGNTTDHSQTTISCSANYTCKITLDAGGGGLSADTGYMYYVEAGADSSAVATFSTAPSGTVDFSFVAYGDNRPSSITGDTTAAESIVSLIESMSPEPKFLLHAGDMYTTNSSSDVQTFFDTTQSLIQNVTIFPARGNHEYLACCAPDRFADYFSLPTNLTADNADAYYSFNYSNSHFLFINTELDCDIGGNDCTISDPQLTAIDGDLAAADADANIEHIFVVMHRSAHSNGDHHGSQENPQLSQVLGPLFVQYDVDIVFQGHDHIYERFQPEGPGGPLSPVDPDIITEGVVHVVTGGGGSPLDTVPAAPTIETDATPNLTSVVSKKTFEAMQIHISGDNIYATVRCANEDLDGDGFLDVGEDCDNDGILDTDGSAILDEFTINKSLACAAEVCDGIDNDCDGLIDEGVTTIYYSDADGDGYGNPSVSTEACSAPAGYVTNNTDCDDTNAGINPGVMEICNDSIDNDCDGLVDTSDPGCPSCPSLYFWNGNDYERRGFIFPGAMPQGNEYRDHIPLNQLPLKDGMYVLQIRETEPENSFIDMAKLIIVDHSPNVDIRNFFMNRNSNLAPHTRTFGMWYNSNIALNALKQNAKLNVLSPISAMHSVIGDVMPLLHFPDDRYVKTYPGDIITLTFPAPSLPQGNVRDFIFVGEGFYVPLNNMP